MFWHKKTLLSEKFTEPSISNNLFWTTNYKSVYAKVHMYFYLYENTQKRG